MAGPILDESENPKGSILVIKFENKKKLEEFLKKDPYTKVNLFETVEIELINILLFIHVNYFIIFRNNIFN